jgi:hypothetical protein
MLDMHRIVADAGLSRTLGSFGENVGGALLRMPLVLVRGVLDLIHLERDRMEWLRDSEESDPRADVLRELDAMPDRLVRQLRAVRWNEKMLEHDMPPLAAHQITATRRLALPDLMAAAVIQCVNIVRQRHQNVRINRIGAGRDQSFAVEPDDPAGRVPRSCLDAPVGSFGGMIRVSLALGTNDTSSWAASPSQEAFLKKASLAVQRMRRGCFWPPEWRHVYEPPRSPDGCPCLGDVACMGANSSCYSRFAAGR